MAKQQSKRNSRWELEGDKELRMSKALQYLETFEINDHEEEEKAAKLSERLTADLKNYSVKVNEAVLFPVRVAKAKDVAASIMRKINREKVAKIKPLFPKLGAQVPPPIFPNTGAQVPPPIFPNTGAQVPPPIFPNTGAQVPPPIFPNTGAQVPPPIFPNTGAQVPPPIFPNTGAQVPPPLFPMPGAQVPPPQFYSAPPPSMAAAAPVSDSSAEDSRFYKKLATMLSALPQNPGASSMASKLLMLKSMFEKKALNIPGDQTSNMAGGTDNPLKQKLLMLLAASQNQSGVPPANPKSMGMVPEPGGEDSVKQKLMKLLASQSPSDLSRLGSQLTSMTSDLGADDPLKQKLLTLLASQKAAGMSQFSMTESSERENILAKAGSADKQKLLQLMLESRRKTGMPKNELTLPGNQNIGRQGYGPMDRNPLPPGNAAFGGAHMDPPVSSRPHLYEDMNRNQRKGERFPDPDAAHGWGPRRPFDGMAPQEMGAPYEKRARQDEEDIFAPRKGERRETRPGDSLPNLSVDLLKRIRGKDMFTVSAILSEYSDK